MNEEQRVPSARYAVAMQIPEINYWAVIVATLSTMVVGALYYHPKLMGTRWMKAVGHDDESVQGGSNLIYLVPVVASFFTSWILAGATWLSFEFYGGSYFVNAIVTALILFVGFTAARVLVHDAFDPRKFRVTGHTLLNEFLTITIVAIIIGVWPPAMA